MKGLLLLVNLFLLFFTANVYSAVGRQCETDTFGNNFVLGFIGYIQPLNEENIQLHITPTLQQTARVRVRAPFLILDRTYDISNFTVITLNGTLIQYEKEKQLKGIEISCDVNITVTAFTGLSLVDALEGFSVLPTDALGTRYITASYAPFGNYDSEFLVAGIHNDTEVVMSISTGSRIRINRTTRLQKFETFQFKTNNDVTGSIISSNKPIAVFAGSAAARIPIGHGDQQYIVEQMIPTKYWTTKFIVPPIYPRKHFVLKFIANHDKTVVNYYNSTNNLSIKMENGAVVETQFGTDPVTVIANNPISVMQYGHDGDGEYGDPFMMTVQGVAQFVDSYSFVTQSYLSTGSNTLAITIASENASELLLNDLSISDWNNRTVSVSSPIGQFLVLFFSLPDNSSYHLSHTEGVKFGAVLYGRPSLYSAYGYPLQLSLSTSENCTSSSTSHSAYPSSTRKAVDFTSKPLQTENYTFSSTSHSAYPSSTRTAVDFTSKSLQTENYTFSSSSHNAYPSSTRTAVEFTSKPLQTGNGTGLVKWCFACEDITHLKYCDRVQRCQNENDVCYVQSYTRKLGVNLFRSGCIKVEQCHNNDTNLGCLHCCMDNFCNSAGCGDNGFQGLVNRGPLCLDCSHIGENEICNNVQLCHSDQACVIEKYEWGDNDFQYYMGCTQPQVCTSKRSIGDRTDRNVPVCSHCCHSDFCNLNCTSVDLGPAIVG